MNFFSRKNRQQDTLGPDDQLFDLAEHGVTSEIAAGVSCEGDVQCEEGLMVLGQIHGNVDFGAAGDHCAILVTPGARIEGNIRGPIVHVLGTVKGHIYADHCWVHPGAHVEGGIEYIVLNVCEEGIIEGVMKRKASSSQASLQPTHLTDYRVASAER